MRDCPGTRSCEEEDRQLPGNQINDRQSIPDRGGSTIQPYLSFTIYHSVGFLQMTQNDVEHTIIIITMNDTMQSLLSLRPNTWSTWVNTQCRSSPCLSKTIPQKPPEYSFPSCSLSGILCRTWTKIWAIVLIFFLTVLSRSCIFYNHNCLTL